MDLYDISVGDAFWYADASGTSLYQKTAECTPEGDCECHLLGYFMMGHWCLMGVPQETNFNAYATIRPACKSDLHQYVVSRA